MDPSFREQDLGFKSFFEYLRQLPQFVLTRTGSTLSVGLQEARLKDTTAESEGDTNKECKSKITSKSAAARLVSQSGRELKLIDPGDKLGRPRLHHPAATQSDNRGLDLLDWAIRAIDIDWDRIVVAGRVKESLLTLNPSLSERDSGFKSCGEYLEL